MQTINVTKIAVEETSHPKVYAVQTIHVTKDKGPNHTRHKGHRSEPYTSQRTKVRTIHVSKDKGPNHTRHKGQRSEPYTSQRTKVQTIHVTKDKGPNHTSQRTKVHMTPLFPCTDVFSFA